LVLEYDGVEYTDDAAQSVIEQNVCMSYSEFVTATYIIQRGINLSVISLSSSEQFRFVEALANLSSEPLKRRTKDKIKEVENIILGIKGEIKAITLQKEEKLSRYEEPPPMPESFEENPPEAIREKISSLNLEHEKISQLINSKRATLDLARKEEKESSSKEMELSKLRLEIANETKRLKVLEAKLESAPSISVVEEEVKDLKSVLDYYKKLIEYLDTKRLYTKATDDYWKDINQKIKILGTPPTDLEMKNIEEKMELAKANNLAYHEQKANYDIQNSKKEGYKKELSTLFRDARTKLGIDPDKQIKGPKQMVVELKSFISAQENLYEYSTRKKLKCPCCEKIVYLISTSEGVSRLESVSKKVVEGGEIGVRTGGDEG
jgi:hypothetical protein